MNARAALVTSRPGAVLYARALAELPPTVVGLEARLSELAIFPVKGLGGVRLLSARVDHRGRCGAHLGLGLSDLDDQWRRLGEEQ